MKNLLALAAFLLSTQALGHDVSAADAGFLEQVQGVAFFPFLYMGAKHMFTGYDHLLFLAGVIFFLFRLREVALFVSLFALGHSLTLLLGVLSGMHVNAWLVDAVIGLSVAYKAYDNMGGFDRLGWRPDARAAVFLFGLVHGFGLSTKLQDLQLSSDGLITNMLAFNMGVELGQLAALIPMLLVFNAWRATPSFQRQAWNANLVLMTAGFLLCGWQLAGFWLSQGTLP